MKKTFNRIVVSWAGVKVLQMTNKLLVKELLVGFFLSLWGWFDYFSKRGNLKTGVERDESN